MLFVILFFTFLVVFHSRVVVVGSTAHAVVKGAKENATWSSSFSADALFIHQIEQWHRYTMGISIRPGG